MGGGDSSDEDEYVFYGTPIVDEADVRAQQQRRGGGSQQQTADPSAVRALLGDAVADRVGPIWGIGADHELQAMYARTAQPGFHVIGGGFAGARAYSTYTAMLIKAEIAGLLERQRLSAA